MNSTSLDTSKINEIIEKINTKLIFELSKEHEKQKNIMEEMLYDNNLRSKELYKKQ
jgi:hypothetical protein